MSSNNTNNRRLAAIIFADIVGYTAMMQNGEAAALQAIKRFESVTREYVDKYQGEIIKNYGDGSLLLFDSTVQAVQCAHDMQIALQESPTVPLRIGIHVGEVVRRDNDVFGHGVNISSRIESLGVAGSVLVSKMIYDKVRNQENFSFKSMGVFDFKNVDEGMQVYALSNKGIVVPRLSEMKGKVKEVNENKSLWANPIFRYAAIGALVLFLGVGGFSLLNKSNAQGPITEMVKYLDENGTEQERLVYNRSLSNRLLIFPPKKIGDIDDEWISLAVAELQMTDLELDNRLFAISPRDIISDMKSKGIEEYDDLSFGLKRKFAADRYVDYFIDSDISQSGNQYEITFNLYQTKDGKKVLTKKYVNEDLFVIVDGFSADLNNFLYKNVDTQSDVPTYVDLPSNELLTSDIQALKYYVQASYNLNRNNDHVSALANLDKALEIDPNFFMATYLKGAVLVPTGNIVEGLKYFEKAIENSEGQPERTQLSVKCQYYLYQNDLDKSTRLAEMWKNLYPQTEEAYKILGNIYKTTGNFGKYKDTYQKAYDQGLKGTFLLKLGEMHTEQSEFDKAEKYFEEFLDLYPDKNGDITQLGDLYLKQGKFDKAIEYFENRTIKEDQNVYNHITLGGAYLKKGEFDKAMSSYNTGLRKAKIAQDSFSVLDAIVNINYLKGNASGFVEKDELKNSVYARFAPSMMVDMQYIAFNTIARYKDCDRLDVIEKKRNTMANSNKMGPINWGCIIDYNKALGLEDPELLEKTKADCSEDIAKATGPSQGKLLESLEHRIKRKYELAASTMDEYIKENNAPRLSLNPYFADLEVELGAYENAIELMEGFVKTDRSSAESYTLLAKAYKGNGDEAKAKETLQKALDIWRDADDSFIPAQEAKTLMVEL